jgi:hypothetical protein
MKDPWSLRSRKVCSVPGGIRLRYAAPGAAPIAPELLARRDFVFERHLPLPMDF